MYSMDGNKRGLRSLERQIREMTRPLYPEISMRAISFILLNFLWWYALSVAIKYGGIWDLKANPTQNAEVNLPHGDTVIGSLNRDWDKTWVITAADGSRTHFTDDATIVFHRSSKSRGYWSRWREIGPAVVVGTAFLAFLLTAIFKMGTPLRRAR
jgi:hypothetical protein